MARTCTYTCAHVKDLAKSFLQITLEWRQPFTATRLSLTHWVKRISYWQKQGQRQAAEMHTVLLYHKLQFQLDSLAVAQPDEQGAEVRTLLIWLSSVCRPGRHCHRCSVCLAISNLQTQS